MEKDKIKKLLAAREAADPPPDSVRTPVAVLFSDIKGSTAYFEQYGDVRGLEMVRRHNAMLFPVIDGCGGRVVKTIGDAIMAVFNDSKSALQAAIGMQRVLEGDRLLQPLPEQIRIKVGLHAGPCLVTEKDVYGDVVNVASRVQNQAEPDQILITEDLLETAKLAGVQCAQMGHENMRGRVEPIEIYAVAWSMTSNDQLIEEIQSQFEKRLKDAKRRQDATEQEFESAREQWRSERRRLTTEIERLGDVVERAKESSRAEASTDLQAEIRLHLEEAVRARQRSEQDLADAQAKWNGEREQWKAQIGSLQRASLEAMEKSNNPTRIALAVREKLDERVAAAKHEWELQWSGERQRLTAEIERLKKAAGISDSPKREEARRALLEKLGKNLPEAAGPAGRTAVQWESDFEAAKTKWDNEQQQLLLRLARAEREMQQAAQDSRAQINEELRSHYEPQLAAAGSDVQRLTQEIAVLSAQLNEERQRNSIRVDLLEKSIPAAKEAARKQAAAELRAEFDIKVEELTRLKLRTERRYQDESEEWEEERRRARRQLAKMEEELREAKETAFRADRIKGRKIQG